MMSKDTSVSSDRLADLGQSLGTVQSDEQFS